MSSSESGQGNKDLVVPPLALARVRLLDFISLDVVDAEDVLEMTMTVWTTSGALHDP